MRVGSAPGARFLGSVVALCVGRIGLSPRLTLTGSSHVRPARSTLHRHHPLPVGGCGAAGQQRTSRHAAGRGADGVRAVEPLAEMQSGQPPLARPRPLRALGRARLDAALQPAVPERLRSVAGRHPQLPPVGQQGARPSRTRPHAGRRSHHRAARTRLRQRGRHGHRRGAAGCPLQPPGPRDHRPPHLRDRQRRRPDGRGRVRGGVAGRASEAGQADLPVRRQRGHAVRRYRHHVHRRPRGAIRGVRLAHGAGCGRQRRRGDRPRPAGGARADNAAVADPGAHAHRLRLAAQARQFRSPRLAAGGGGGPVDQGAAGLADRAAVPGSGRGARAHA